jgi:uncharacterized protein (TIGR02145 family)
MYLRSIFAAVFDNPNQTMKIRILLTAFLLLSSLSYWAQTQLQYQINQQGGGSCAGSPVELSVKILATSDHLCGAENVHNSNLNYGRMTDQDGNIYKTIVIGNQEWMAENLKVSHYRNGDIIANVPENSLWSSLTTGAWCYNYNESFSECPFGKIYNWYTVADQRNVCPADWHVPTDSEWNDLIGFLDSSFDPNSSFNPTTVYQSSSAGVKMKSNWLDLSQYATNESGFSGILSGGRTADGTFSSGNVGIWWSSSENEANNSTAWYRAIYSDNGFVGRNDEFKQVGLSVRCLKD